MEKIINFLKEFFSKDYWVKDFPKDRYHPHDECFMCNRESCEGCPFE